MAPSDPPAAAPTDPIALAAEFARRACIQRASLPAEFNAGPSQSLRPAWERHFTARAMEAPPSFLALLDCEGEVMIEFGGWGVLSPDASDYYRSLFAQSRHPLPVDAVYGAMTPLFCCDGDLLLLDRDGAVYGYQHDGDTEADAPVAPSFEALLRTLLDVLDGRAAYPLDLYARAVNRARSRRTP